MTRSSRLLQLLQVLRRHRRPVAGSVLAAELGVSLRTIYRDIQTLTAQGAPIDGEAGLGFVLRPGFVLPPLMLSEGEAEALVLGARWVASQGDTTLAEAARNAIAKIAAVLPPDLGELVEGSPLLVPVCEAGVDLSEARRSIRQEKIVCIAYRDAADVASQRQIWPFALGFFEKVRVLAAFCETRQDFRHFRLDRITEWRTLDAAYPRRRRALLREWREKEMVPPPPC